jgi:hypothetical protein
VVAKSDPSAKIKSSVIQTLQFRHSDRLVRDVLSSAPDEVWQELAVDDYGDEIADPGMSARLRDLRDRAIGNEPDPMRRIGMMLRVPKSPETAAAVVQACETADFKTIGTDAAWTLARAYELYPGEISAALVRRLQAGREIPQNSEELLARSPTVDDGPIRDLILAGSSTRVVSNAAVIAGPNTVRALIEKVLALHDQAKVAGRKLSSGEWEEHHRLVDVLAKTRLNVFGEAWLDLADTDDPEKIARLSDVFARHGTRYNEQAVFPLDDATQAKLVTVCVRWIDILLTAPTGDRRDFAEVARMATRIGSEELAVPLSRLLKQDLVRWRRARDAFRQAPQKGEVGPAAGARMGYNPQYSRAFAAIGGERVGEIMRGFLRDPDFGGDAAYILKQIYEARSGSSEDPNKMRPQVDFARASVRRAERIKGTETTSPEGEAILDAASALLAPDAAETSKGLALRLAIIGFSVPHNDRPKLVEDLLAMTLPDRAVWQLLTALVVDGHTVSADRILRGIESWLRDPNNRWRREAWELENWLSLLPFSDRPIALLDGIDLAGDAAKPVSHLRQLLSALKQAPINEFENIWIEMLKRDPELLNSHDWLASLVDVERDERCLLLLDLICDPAIPKRMERFEVWWVSNLLSSCLRRSESLRRDCIRRYQDPQMQACHPLLEQSFEKSPDIESVLAVAQRYAATGRSYDATLSSMMEEIVLERRPVSTWKNAYELHSVNAAELRKQLFAMTSPDRTEVRIAEACLKTIDRLRDEHGRPGDEPRHPDISDGRPWPLITE